MKDIVIKIHITINHILDVSKLHPSILLTTTHVFVIFGIILINIIGIYEIIVNVNYTKSFFQNYTKYDLIKLIIIFVIPFYLVLKSYIGKQDYEKIQLSKTELENWIFWYRFIGVLSLIFAFVIALLKDKLIN